MRGYSVQPRDQISVKGYRFLFFAKYICKNIGKNTSKNLSSKYSQKLLDLTNQYATDALRTSPKRVIQKTTKETSDLIGNKIANKIRVVSQNSQQNN